MGLSQCDRVAQTSPFITLSFTEEWETPLSHRTVPHLPLQPLMGSYKEWRQTGLHGPVVACCLLGGSPVQSPESFRTIQKRHIFLKRDADFRYHTIDTMEPSNWNGPRSLMLGGRRRLQPQCQPWGGTCLPGGDFLERWLLERRLAAWGQPFRRTASLFTICLTLRQVSPDGHRERGHWILCSSSRCGHLVTFLCFPLLFILE